MEIHPFNKLVPELSAQELCELTDDIRAHGQIYAVVLDQHGRVVDGKHRVQVCESLGITPETETRTFATDKDVLAFIISTLTRRNLKEGQRAMIAADLANMGQGERTDLAEPSANLQKVTSTASAVSQADAGKMLNVSTRSVAAAKRVRKQGTEKLQKAVRDGKMAVSRAAKKTKESPMEQDKAADEAYKSNGRKRQQANAVPIESFAKMLEWASTVERVTGEKMAKKFGTSAKHSDNKLVSAAQSVGFYVEDFGDAGFKVSKAVHFPRVRDVEGACTDLPKIMGELVDMAHEAQERDSGRTSGSWMKQERAEFLQKLLYIIGPLSKTRRES
jgi:hypothetical protein